MNEDQQRVEQIRREATKFRTAITKCDPTAYPRFFETFPRGRCGLASDLLATYLFDQGLGLLTYLNAYRGSMEDGTYHSHGWLQQDGIIVDITADQFDDIEDEVIVAIFRFGMLLLPYSVAIQPG